MAETPLGHDQKVLEIPAHFVNHIHLSRLGPLLVRLTFAEAAVQNVPTYRSAVVMTTEDAQSLVALLQKALALNIVPQSADPRPN